jgi:hypothetical protein
MIQKMKPKTILYFWIVVTVILSGCVSNGPMPVTDLSTSEPDTLATLFAPPATSSTTSTATKTPALTHPVTLEPEQAEEAVKTLLQEPTDCRAPCFWNIIPDQTTLNEAKDTFAHLGLQLEYSITANGNDFFGAAYKLDSGLMGAVTLTIRDDIVKNIRVVINPGKLQQGVSQEWFAYSPSTLVNCYGTPSKVEFFIGRATPLNAYTIVMYFDEVDMIIEYYGYDLPLKDKSFFICPLNSRFDIINVWLGENPEQTPPEAVPLEKAALMSRERFAELMTGDVQDSCFTLYEDAFP